MKKFEYIGATDNVFVYGMVYDVVCEVTGVRVYLKGKLISRLDYREFNNLFSEDFPHKALCTFNDADIGFTYGKTYGYRIEKDKKSPYVLIRDDGITAYMGEEAFSKIFKELPNVKYDDTATGNEAGYMVFVDGGRSPKHIHKTIMDAEQEARRLSFQNTNIGKDVYVLSVQKKFRSRVVVDEEV